MKRIGNLWEELTSFANLVEAAKAQRPARGAGRMSRLFCSIWNRNCSAFGGNCARIGMSRVPTGLSGCWTQSQDRFPPRRSVTALSIMR